MSLPIMHAQVINSSFTMFQVCPLLLHSVLKPESSVTCSTGLVSVCQLYTFRAMFV